MPRYEVVVEETVTQRVVCIVEAHCAHEAKQFAEEGNTVEEGPGVMDRVIDRIAVEGPKEID